MKKETVLCVFKFFKQMRGNDNMDQTEEKKNEVQLNLLPVEQGDCLHLRFRSGDIWHNIVMDSGPAKTAGVFRHLVETIRRRNEVIDLLCFSHIDDDHIKGAERVLKDVGFDASVIKHIWLNLPEHIANQKNTLGKYRAATVVTALNLWTAINTHHISCDTLIEAGKEIKIGDMEIEVVLPSKVRLNEYWEKWEEDAEKRGVYTPRSTFQRDPNKYNGVSIVLLCKIGTTNLLLTGDAYAVDLENVGETHSDSNLTLMKLPHHGSSNNISMDMLEAFDCDKFLISTKQTGKHPSPDALSLLDEYGEKSKRQ